MRCWKSFVGLGLFSVAALASRAWAPPIAPANDNCASATVITDATCGAFEDEGVTDTTNATTEGGEPAATCGAGGSHSVWYQFTTSITRLVKVDTEGSAYDTVIQVFSGTCGSTTPVACNDDSGPGLTSLLAFTAQAGVPYLIRVSSFDNSSGGSLDFTLECRLCAESTRGGGGAILLDQLSGDYQVCCNSGASQSGTAVLTQRGACRLSFADTTGGNKVLGTFDLCRNVADASFQSPATVTQCTIGDNNTRGDLLCGGCGN